MSEPTATSAVYRQSAVRPPETSPMIEAVRAMRRAPADERRAFWDGLREAFEDMPDAPPPPYRDTTKPVKPSLVYYLRFGDRVKIGYTTNLPERLRVLPHDEVLATEPGTLADERSLHQRFAALRVHGEWFRYEEPLCSHIDGLR